MPEQNAIEIPLSVEYDDSVEGEETYVGVGTEKMIVDLSKVSFRVLHPEEGSDEALLLIERTGKRRFDASEEDFIEEIQRAEDHFAKVPGGYVGYGYFVHHWHSKAIPFGLRARDPMLTKLAKEGKIVIYTAPDGKKALRLP